MRWNYTKSFALLVVIQFALRIPLTYAIDEKPFVTGGVFWVGVNLVIMALPIGALMDLVAYARQAVRNRRASSLR